MKAPYKNVMRNKDRNFSFAFRTYFYEQCGGACEYCGSSIASKSDMSIDHIVPRTAGGTHEVSNLRAACGSCNTSKGNRDVEYLRAVLRLRASVLDGIITPNQLRILEEVGASLPVPKTFVFAFERGLS